MFLFAPCGQAQELPEPLTDAAFLQVDPLLASFGALLFFDPILSGNKNISCATCHHPSNGTSDGMALGFGEGGIGLGLDRSQGDARVRQSRNAPGLWNLGAFEVRRLFHDGRVERDGTGFRTPAGRQLPRGLDSVLAAQALFPLIARSEMAGDPGENTIAVAAQNNAPLAWKLIAERVTRNKGYAELFAASGSADVDDISMIANALAAYISKEFRAINAPFDQFLDGDTEAISTQAKDGMGLFYGKAGCSICHKGSLFSDQEFHSLGLPQFGPGLTRRFDPVARDVGRMAVTDRIVDAYKFRTPFLRNVALTAPYGHNGAYADMEEIIQHHLDAPVAPNSWRAVDVALPDYESSLAIDDFALSLDASEQVRIRRSITIKPVSLTDAEISSIVVFLHSLTTVKIDLPSKPKEALSSGLHFQ